MRIGLLTLLWKRPVISDMVLSYYNRMELDGITLVKHAVGSEGETSRYLAERNGWNYTEHPNQPFTDKWNAAMQPFSEWNVEAVVIIGSDNLHNEAYFYMVRDLISVGIDSIRLYCHYSLDVPTKRMFFYRNVTIGTGRAFSFGLLEKLDYKPWRPGKPRNADGHLNNNVWPYESRIARLHTPYKAGAVSVDLKTGQDMHGFDAIYTAIPTSQVDYQFFFNRYFPSVIFPPEK